MATYCDDLALYQPCESPLQPELVIASALHLMSHYTVDDHDAEACIRLACVIQRHLRCLAGMTGLSPVLQATCQQLSEDWEQRVNRRMPTSQTAGFFTRMLLGVHAA